MSKSLALVALPIKLWLESNELCENECDNCSLNELAVSGLSKSHYVEICTAEVCA